MRFTTLATAACGIALSASLALGTGGAFAQSVNTVPASLISGSCAEPGAEVAPLRDATSKSGEPQGSEWALAVWESDTELNLGLTETLASPHAILVGVSASPVACGDIGGVVDDDRDLAIGLQALQNPGYYGIADLDGDDDDDDDGELEVHIRLVVSAN